MKYFEKMQRRKKQKEIVHRFLCDVPFEVNSGTPHSIEWFETHLDSWNSLNLEKLTRSEIAFITRSIFEIYKEDYVTSTILNDVLELVSREQWHNENLEDLAAFFNSVGAFGISAAISQLNYKNYKANLYNLDFENYLIANFKVAIQMSDKDSAISINSEIQKRRLKQHLKLGKFAKQSNIYTLMWSKDNLKSVVKAKSNSWVKIVQNNHVIIVGPAKISASTLIRNNQELIARRLSDSRKEFDENYYGGLNHLPYVDEVFMKLLSYNQNLNILNKYKIVSGNFNVLGNYFQLDNLRSANSPNRLFFNGAAFKIPMMIFDLLLGLPESISLYGASFYTDNQNYREDSVDFNGQNHLAVINDVVNSGFRKKLDFTFLASHGIQENFMFTKNLLHLFQNIGAETKNILEMSLENYCLKLQNNYGIGAD